MDPLKVRAILLELNHFYLDWRRGFRLLSAELHTVHRSGSIGEGTVRLHRALWLAIGIVLLGVSSALAQEASIIGSVADQTKAVLPGVTITATELSTGNQ
ncbi:MAG TPA: hypothetical protein VGY57_15025, partial [Vicinamibacterales bacterium]|nr:hypothetical protein [Vicinamibacterales bacterium]